jgi:cell fate regulator YaaT (PSP1 superfamily)
MVKRDKLWKFMCKNGIERKLYRAIKSIYHSVKSCVRTSEGLTNYFNCGNGLNQGC